ncbi:MAG: hypothetical protein JOZ68_02630 [Acidimicrobiia bacterium]|nr:hypothetical protein [Acidimicrobiia bacterium]MBV8985419.1 hypothetical protein [Acidimicrobiia bacterium]MBV9039869.1 hypothetical protein [Acidimicrobiia bacterium]MBV9285558.1 hypothetical protein [Acidimicrobiia bacterium]
MRRRTVVLAFLAAIGLIFGPLLLRANAVQLPNGQTQTTTGTCTLSYTLTGSFRLVGGATTFTLGASGSCIGVPSGPATVDITFNSLGSWSCVGGTALGTGAVDTPGNGSELVSAALVNSGGQYVVQIYSLTSAFSGNIGTLPSPCIGGSTQSTITGNGTLTYTT